MGALAISPECTIRMPQRAPKLFTGTAVYESSYAQTTYARHPTVPGNVVLSVKSGFGGLFLFKKNLLLPQPLPGLPFLLILKRLQGFLRLCS